jgi:hypothetical protein
MIKANVILTGVEHNVRPNCRLRDAAGLMSVASNSLGYWYRFQSVTAIPPLPERWTEPRPERPIG